MNPTRRAIFGAAASAVVGARSAAKAVAETFAEAGMTTAINHASLGQAIGGVNEVPGGLYPSTAAQPPRWAMEAARWREAFNEATCRPPDPAVAAIRSYSGVYRAMKNADVVVAHRFEGAFDRAWKLAKEIGP